MVCMPNAVARQMSRGFVNLRGAAVPDGPGPLLEVPLRSRWWAAAARQAQMPTVIQTPFDVMMLAAL